MQQKAANLSLHWSVAVDVTAFTMHADGVQGGHASHKHSIPGCWTSPLLLLQGMSAVQDRVQQMCLWKAGRCRGCSPGAALRRPACSTSQDLSR